MRTVGTVTAFRVRFFTGKSLVQVLHRQAHDAASLFQGFGGPCNMHRAHETTPRDALCHLEDYLVRLGCSEHDPLPQTLSVAC